MNLPLPDGGRRSGPAGGRPGGGACPVGLAVGRLIVVPRGRVR
ncbi:MAG: hypothetical protein AVDCRST_MAG49-4495 [uncultured Thermomicrobiales bacterium]|uniref:Uncharacterized protein n=1 Tax=uncultured Thermomicrobiales bacterium TaxID=1645740 RepID=A0A6J4VH34_9BACT|nr:MAG: hypothetical protein AVDCRST_MAG49-4495 [uncultured Thermomicrobiales bacterium]